MIPTFPEFKKISRGDVEQVSKYTNNFLPYSDFNFTSFLCWDTEKVRKISVLNDNLVFLMSDYNTGKPVLSFLGNKKPTTTARTLIEYSKQKKLNETIQFVPEVVARKISNKLSVVEDPGNFDYVFKLKNFIHFPGNKFKSKRRLLKAFLENYSDAEFKHTKLTSETEIAIKDILGSWEKNKIEDGKSYDLEHERGAIDRLLSLKPSKELRFSAVYIDDKPAAFSIDEPLTKRYVISHFSKAHRSYKGVNEFLNHNIAKSFIKNGYLYWNWEQDLDETNLRNSKMNYKPIRFLKKYTVSEFQ